LFGVTSAFAFNGVTYIAILAALFMVKLAPAEERIQRRGEVWQDMKEGIHYAMTQQTIRQVLIILGVSAVLVRGPLELLPAFADDVFDLGSGGLAILTSAAGGGAIIAGLLLSQGLRSLRIETVATTIAAVGVLIVLFGLTEEFWIAVGIIALLGFGLSLSGVGSQILLQNAADDQYRGRVSSFWGLITFGGTALGGLVVGGISSVWGLKTTTVCSGVLCILLALIVLARRASADPPASASA
jgi:predicted MFS family arabinose efflux permease